MSDQTGIEWTDATWNPVAGCAVVSPGCTNCYAMKFAARLATMPQAKVKYAGLTQPSKAGPVWTGKIALDHSALIQPLRWKKPRRIFVNSMSDLFHESVPDAFIDKVFAVMALTPQHTYQVLTKRADRMRDYLSKKTRKLPIAYAACEINERLHPHLTPNQISAMTNAQEPAWPLPNVWLGVSVENQKFADERIPLLLDTPAAVRWISAEPLLGPIDLVNLHPRADITVDAIRGQMVTREGDYSGDEPRLDWVVVGGESGPGARPMHPDWARDIRDQCAAAGVPFFFKQWGEWAPGENALKAPTRTETGASWFAEKWLFERITVKTSEELHCDDAPDVYRLGKKAAGHLLDGVEHRAFPR